MKRGTIAIIAVAMLTAGCASGKPERRPEQPPVKVPAEFPAPVISQQRPQSIAEQLAGQTGVTEVRMTDQGFVPTEIKTTQGGVVKLHVRNESSGEHNLVIARFGIAARTLLPGEENYIEFTANEKGTWTMISDAPGAPEPAFSGRLQVE